MVSCENTSLPADSARALASACDFTEVALPIDCAFATVGAIAQNTTNGSVEINSRPNVPVIFVLTLLAEPAKVSFCDHHHIHRTGNFGPN
jgi:hypothetical protein